MWSRRWKVESMGESPNSGQATKWSDRKASQLRMHQAPMLNLPLREVCLWVSLVVNAPASSVGEPTVSPSTPISITCTRAVWKKTLLSANGPGPSVVPQPAGSAALGGFTEDFSNLAGAQHGPDNYCSIIKSSRRGQHRAAMLLYERDNEITDPGFPRNDERLVVWACSAAARSLLGLKRSSLSFEHSLDTLTAARLRWAARRSSLCSLSSLDRLTKFPATFARCWHKNAPKPSHPRWRQYP